MFVGVEGHPCVTPREEEMMVSTIRAFMKTDGFRYYLLDGEVTVVNSDCYVYNCWFWVVPVRIS